MLSDGNGPGTDRLKGRFGEDMMAKEADVMISVIVTVHNAEKYLKECMDSVTGQTFTEIEILCVDGGSTDSSPHILREYAKKDDRVRIIDDPNTSYGHKVNEGIRQARGEYISVLESDDMYEPFMLEKLYEVARQYHPDMVDADYTSFYDINGVRFTEVTQMYQKNDYNCLLRNREHPEQMRDITRFWTGIFLKDFLDREQIRMNESKGASYQDMSFRFLTSVLAATSYHLDIPVYLYRIDNPDSSMQDTKKTTVIADEHAFLKKELEKRDIREPIIWHNAYRWKYNDMRGNMHHLRGQYRMELFGRYREELERDRTALERYRLNGYESSVQEMIDRSPEEMKQILDDETNERLNRKNKEYRFLEKITGLESKAKVILFGCGKRGQAALEKLVFMKDKLCAVTDNNRDVWGSDIREKRIISPAEAFSLYPQAYYLIANKYNTEDICQQLKENGISEEKILLYEL